MKPRWGTQTAKGQTCHVGLTTRREARKLADEWSAKFPEYAPYRATRNGVAI